MKLNFILINAMLKNEGWEKLFIRFTYLKKSSPVHSVIFQFNYVH